ncbi:hypothetical protein ACROYT_G040047 [Oculina patagonica]
MVKSKLLVWPFLQSKQHYYCPWFSTCTETRHWDKTPTNSLRRTGAESACCEQIGKRTHTRAQATRDIGHSSKVYIQSVTVLNHTKTFGGDAWRVRVNGRADLTATVHDMENGTYQAVFLPMEPGTYSLHIVLDYTLCHGLKNPPPDWFRKGCRHGSFQSPGTLTTSDDYIDRPLYYGAYFTIKVPPTVPQDAQYLDSLFNTSTQWCNEGCNLLWDGFGRWVNNNWLQYKSNDYSYPRSGHRQGSGVLWIYGDSHNRRFFESLQGRQLCTRVFRACYHTDVWVYWLDAVISNEIDLSHGGNDINITRILEELRQVVTQPLMDQDSALVLNAGVHLLKSTSFRNYQKIIKGFVRLLRDNYRGKVVWKTIPSLGKQTELYTGCSRRFHTEQRIKLFNAYALKKMCEAGIPVLDVYQISAAYPQGTIDDIHYPHSVFYPAEDALERYFTT